MIDKAINPFDTLEKGQKSIRLKGWDPIVAMTHAAPLLRPFPIFPRHHALLT